MTGGHESLHLQVHEFDEESVPAGIGDNGGENHGFSGVEEIFKVFDFLEAAGFHFRLGGDSFGLGQMRGDLGEFVDFRQSGRQARLVAEPRARDTMGDQIRIPADRTGEMEVVGLGESVMAERFGGITRALQALEQGKFEGVFLRLAFDAEQQFPQGGATVAGSGAETVEAGEFAEFREFALIRILVHAVGASHAGAAQDGGDGLVGGEHTFLDQLVRDIILDLAQFDGPPGTIEDDLHFGEVEIERTLAEAAFAQTLGHPPCLGQHGGGGILGEVFFFHLEELENLLVSEAAGAADDGAGQPRGGDLSIGTDFHFHEPREAIPAGHKAAEPVAQRFR